MPERGEVEAVETMNRRFSVHRACRVWVWAWAWRVRVEMRKDRSCTRPLGTTTPAAAQGDVPRFACLQGCTGYCIRARGRGLRTFCPGVRGRSKRRHPAGAGLSPHEPKACKKKLPVQFLYGAQKGKRTAAGSGWVLPAVILYGVCNPLNMTL